MAEDEGVWAEDEAVGIVLIQLVVVFRNICSRKVVVFTERPSHSLLLLECSAFPTFPITLLQRGMGNVGL